MSKIAFERAFQELSEIEINELMEKSHYLVFQADTEIMREGEDPNQIMVILGGEIRVVRYGQNGKETELSSPLGPGDTVGEMSFIDHMGASATLIANTDVAVKSIDPNLVEEMTKHHQGFRERFYHSLLHTVIRRLRLLDYKISFGG
ncbi:cyclic nucleotide-binding domain-containing protein [Terasakiella sp. SH-1]|uniref:Crp/Fnr family transcriptional regulator n=1 Tax=Terasakiella sp. SH-1 TaxID=2560057 RepID=UPI00107374F4|nr:cyclic nucleotide-binding domain-containing protein [Terasakiella sp. SH-1]